MNEWTVIEYSILAAAILLISACMGSFLKMGPRTISLTQHFTAGIVFAAIATELLPKIAEVHSPLHIATGFCLGVILMVGIKTFTERMQTSDSYERSDPFSWGLLISIGIDLFIDGLLIAIAFLSGEKTGKIMALALVLEVAFLSLSLSANLIQKKVPPLFKIGIFVALSLMIPFGTWSGIFILNLLPPAFFTEALSFGAAALLYLVTEELLTEAHEVKDTPIITSSFFLGFLMIFLLKDL